MLRKITPQEMHLMHWKNNGGKTTQILISPADATSDNFDWRISSALVNQSGSFSNYIGVDRSLAILNGGPLQLQIKASDKKIHADLETTVTLTTESAPYRFCGELFVYSKLLSATPVSDFNVMTRRDLYAHDLQYLKINSRTELFGQKIILYCTAGRLLCKEINEHSDPSIWITSGETLEFTSDVSNTSKRIILEATKEQFAHVLVTNIYNKAQH